MIQKTYVFSKDYQMKTSYFKRTALSTLHSDEYESVYENLSAFLQSEWIPAVFEYILQDKEFVRKMDLFTTKNYFHGMNLFEFIFFECKQHQIARHIEDEYKTENEIFEMLIGSDFFKNDNIWIQSIDKRCSKYPPRMCKMDVVYEYGDHEAVSKTFGTKIGKQMLLNPNLILQYADQRKLHRLNNDLTINIKMNIKYQHKYDDSDKCETRIWRHNSSDITFKIGSDLNLKIDTKEIIIK